MKALIAAAAIFAIVAALFFWLSFAGDNSDARALAGILKIPAAVFGLLAGVCALLAAIKGAF